jgi:hypothetical protein
VVLLEKGGERELSARLERDFERRFERKPLVEFFEGDSGPREVVL